MLLSFAVLRSLTQNLRKGTSNQDCHLLPAGKGLTGLQSFTPAELTSLPCPTKRAVVSIAETALPGAGSSMGKCLLAPAKNKIK